MKYVDGVPDGEINKITHLNAMKHFSYNPFSVRPKDQCTVSALRAEAADVDTSVVSRSKGGPKEKHTGIVDLGTVTKRLDSMGKDPD